MIPETSAPGLTLTGAGFVGEGRLFSALTLDLPPGRWTSLLGASGVGKSTLLRVMAGLETGVRFDGRVTASDGLPIAGRVALMAQSDLLAPWLDILGNVTLGATLRGERSDRDRAFALLEQTGLADHARKRPHTLSGGQRQRAALARTLMEDRPIILLDEPFSALDARMRAEMQELAGSLLAGRTVLLVTHEPAEAARLSHAAWLMSATGLEALALPDTAPVRDLEDPDFLQAQAALFARLRARDPVGYDPGGDDAR
ncbi:ATP-binding cassette domain-containing protein [Fodinicurvata sp. EGI_FJ10296]|uniref:ABC transporter ATP-binding protein n=1 Tax=Fodinicurvata sp. EGI_FJ10296 TaxID=3231908 RepID=UPI0034515DB9